MDILLAALSGLLFACLFPPANAPLSWIALVPMVWALERASPRRAFVLGGLYGFMIAVGITAWLMPTAQDYFERPLSTAFLLIATVGLTTVAPYLACSLALLARVRQSFSRTTWLLLFPVAWVAADYARSELGLRSSWGMLAVAHVDSPRLRQIAGLAGPYGVTGLVALGNVVVAEILRLLWQLGRTTAAREVQDPGRRSALRTRWTKAADLRPLRLCGVSFAALLVGALLYGEQRRIAPPDTDLEVAMVQGNYDRSQRWKRAQAKHILAHYLRLSREVAESSEGPPDLYLWPENSLQIAADDPVYGPILERAVAHLGAPLLLGSPRSDSESRSFNSAFYLEPGRRAIHYDKMRLLPFSETHPVASLRAGPRRGDSQVTRYSAGTRPGVFGWRDEQLGVLICFEAIYPSVARQVALEGASLLVNLSNDGWYRGTGGPEQHLEQVIFRSVETGLPILRVTTTGITAVVDATGEVIARLEEDRSAVLRATLPGARARPTLYSQIGDTFALGCALILASAALLSLVPQLVKSPASRPIPSEGGL